MKRTNGSDADWNVPILFLRSKSNPSLYLLDKWSRFRIQAKKTAIPFDSINLANELLRIDLSSFFAEMASWHLYYRKYRPLYVLSNKDGLNRHPLNFNSDKHCFFHKSRERWKRLKSTPYIDSVDGFNFKKTYFANWSEYDRWRKAQPPVSPDFDTAISDALNRSSHGPVSTKTKDLLANACSVCLRCDSASVPDPLYYSYLFGAIADECAVINDLFALVCSDFNFINQYHPADLFSSYLRLEKPDLDRPVTGISFELIKEPILTSYTPKTCFADFIRGTTSVLLTNHDLDYLRALYAVSMQACLNIAGAPQNSLAKKPLRDLEQQLIQAYIDVSNSELKKMPQELDAVISLCSRVLLASTKHDGPDFNKLSDLLNELQKLRASNYFRSLAQLSNPPSQNISRDPSAEKHTEQEEDYHRTRPLHRAAISKFRGPLVRSAELSDQESALEQVKRQAIIRHAEDTCLLETEWSFSKFYARLLSELLNCGKIPIRCKSCGSLFFPTGSNSQYCDRFDPTTNLYCNPRLNEKKRLGRKAPHGTAINLHKKAETAKQLNEKRRHAYFAELEEFVDHEIGPVYFKSALISDELYRSWRAAINNPKNQPKAKSPEQLAFPHPVIWEDQVINGNQEIAVYLNQYAYPALRDKLVQSAKSSKSSCTVIDKPTIRFGGYKLRLFDLLHLIASINNDKEHIQDGPIPVPGLGAMDEFTPDRSPLEPWPEGKERLLRFPSSGKGRLILFEIIDDKRSKQLQQDLTHAAPQPQPKKFQW